MFCHNVNKTHGYIKCIVHDLNHPQDNRKIQKYKT